MTAIIEADELPNLGKVYDKIIREEAPLNSVTSREVVLQEAIGFVSWREGQAEDSATKRDAREVYAARSNTSSANY